MKRLTRASVRPKRSSATSDLRTRPVPARKKLWVGNGARPSMSRPNRMNRNEAVDQSVSTPKKIIGHFRSEDSSRSGTEETLGRQWGPSIDVEAESDEQK